MTDVLRAIAVIYGASLTAIVVYIVALTVDDRRNRSRPAMMDRLAGHETVICAGCHTLRHIPYTSVVVSPRTTSYECPSCGRVAVEHTAPPTTSDVAALVTAGALWVRTDPPADAVIDRRVARYAREIAVTDPPALWAELEDVR